MQSNPLNTTTNTNSQKSGFKKTIKKAQATEPLSFTTAACGARQGRHLGKSQDQRLLPEGWAGGSPPMTVAAGSSIPARLATLSCRELAFKATAKC